jgi:hypothetical protein
MRRNRGTLAAGPSPGWGSMKALYYGDNLQVLRESIASESVDLVHLDRPFNSSRRAEHE